MQKEKKEIDNISIYSSDNGSSKSESSNSKVNYEEMIYEIS